MARRPLPPWHLWGGTKTLVCPYTGIFSTTAATEQTNKISYGRPDSWNFFFHAKVVEQTLAVTPSTVTATIELSFHLTIGIGRSSTTINDFEEYTFSAAPGSSLVGLVCYSTSVIAPARFGGSTDPNTITEIVAQDIQMNVEGVYTFGETHGDSARIEISTYFAPIHHTRPEWFLAEFPGGEEVGA